MKAYRHGEMAFIETSKIPNLEVSKTSVFATGSHGNDHSFTGGDLYLLDKPQGQIVGYFHAKDTKLFHPEHSPEGCNLPDGKYELRKQVEFTPEGLIPVID